mmetsp:Transcript_13506/g.33152  ORF Transcript_13506/g.33152 Transcript_13506/m.33152 type:complete len:224 (+) Transcript_13506:1718-2389(+)
MSAAPDVFVLLAEDAKPVLPSARALAAPIWGELAYARFMPFDIEEIPGLSVIVCPGANAPPAADGAVDAEVAPLPVVVPIATATAACLLSLLLALPLLSAGRSPAALLPTCSSSSSSSFTKAALLPFREPTSPLIDMSKLPLLLRPIDDVLKRGLFICSSGNPPFCGLPGLAARLLLPKKFPLDAACPAPAAYPNGALADSSFDLLLLPSFFCRTCSRPSFPT